MYVRICKGKDINRGIVFKSIFRLVKLIKFIVFIWLVIEFCEIINLILYVFFFSNV